MKKEVFDALPLVSRTELIELRKYFLNKFENNSGLIAEHQANNDQMLNTYKDFTGQFTFSITFLKYAPELKKNTYRVDFRPTSSVSVGGTGRMATFDDIKSLFEKWLTLVDRMHEVKEEYFNPHKEFYERQFADFFTNDDEDAAVNPFDLDRQNLIYHFLEYAEVRILGSTELTEEGKSELVNEVTILKSDLSEKTKKRFVASLSKFAEKVEKHSKKLFHDIFDVFKKEQIKRLLNEGFVYLNDVKTDVLTWIESMGNSS